MEPQIGIGIGPIQDSCGRDLYMISPLGGIIRSIHRKHFFENAKKSENCTQHAYGLYLTLKKFSSKFNLHLENKKDKFYCE
jgi:hypothetical protein